MDNKLKHIIQQISCAHKDKIGINARHYLEVNIGRQAEQMGISDLPDQFRSAAVIVPLKEPLAGMKVRVDGRTFVDYGGFDSGLAAPGYVARASGLPFHPYVAHDSMVLNFA